MGNPGGSGVRVDKGKGWGIDFQTPDPSRHPWAKNPYRLFLGFNKLIARCGQCYKFTLKAIQFNLMQKKQKSSLLYTLTTSGAIFNSR